MKIAIIAPSEHFFNLWIKENAVPSEIYLFVDSIEKTTGNFFEDYFIADYGNQCDYKGATLEELKTEVILRTKKNNN